MSLPGPDYQLVSSNYENGNPFRTYRYVQKPDFAAGGASGQIVRPSSSATAETGNIDLNAKQRASSIGDPVPIVFGRRVNNNGGVFISPGATEARFDTTIVKNIIIQGSLYEIVYKLNTSYLLPLSEGLIGDISVKDVFQGTRRVGEHTQAYSARAGLWAPGYFVIKSPFSGSPTPDCPEICGSVGLYPGISTLSFSVQTDYGLTDSWSFQVHVFIRNGMYVTRLLDGIYGPSNNFADLLKWIFENVKKTPAALIDNAAMLTAAQFLEVNQFTCNTYIPESIEYATILDEWAKYFLLQSVRIDGKDSLRPLLPVNPDGTINTGQTTWEYTFDEALIVPDSLQITYMPLQERTPFVAQMIWRQQPDSDIGITRTFEVRYGTTAADGPYEKHDLSAFCTNENHAAKVGAYIVSSRINVSHAISFTAIPGTHSYGLKTGDIIQVKLKRDFEGSAESNFNYLYKVLEIAKEPDGSVDYDCIHFPVNTEGQSLVALDVVSAVGTGYVMESRSGVNNDATSDRKDDDTVPPSTSIVPGGPTDPSSWGPPTYVWYNNGVEIPGENGPTYTPNTGDIGDTITSTITYPDGGTIDGGPFVIGPGDVGSGLDAGTGGPGGTGGATGGGAGSSGSVGSGSGGGGGSATTAYGSLGEGGGSSSASNPSGSLSGGTLTGPGIQGIPEPGNTLTYDLGCDGAYIEWRLIDNTTGTITVVSQGVAATYIPDSGANNKTVVGVGKCPDPSSPTGYGPEISSPPLLITDGFVPVPNPGATVGWIKTTQLWSGGRNDCGSNTFHDFGLIASSVSSGSYANIVSYKVLDQYSTAIYNCGGVNGGGIPKNIGVMLKRANGTEILVGSLQLDNNAANATGVYGITRSYNLVDLTYLGVSFYTSPAAETPPWSP